MKIYRPSDQQEYEKQWSKYRLSILQSWNWSEVKTDSSETIRVRLGSYPLTLFIKVVPFVGWRFGYIPHAGPKGFFTKENSANLVSLMKEHSLSHVLIDPYVTTDELTLPDLMQFSNEPWIQSQNTIITSLLESDDEMLQRMRKKHRQYIRKSERNGLIFETDDTQAGAKRFGKLMNDQYTTKSFLAYSADYFLKVWQSFEDTNRVHIHFAVKDSKDFGAYMVIDGSDTVFQFFGGTTEQGRKNYAAYLLTWKSMLAARDRGFKLYDQWGTAPYADSDFDKSDEKYGISVFKQGFWGETVRYTDQIVVVGDNFRFTVYKFLIKLHRIYVKTRKKLH